MGIMLYQMSQDTERLDGGKLLYISSSLYEGDWHSTPHSHYFTEMFYVRRGKGQFYINGEYFPVEEDDLVLINPHTEHTEMSISADPLEYIVLGVDGVSLLFNEQEDEFSDQRYSVFNYQKQRRTLMFYFDAIVLEMEKKELHHEMVCQDLLEVLLVHIMRSSNYSFSYIANQKSSPECSAVKRHIDFNYAETITLDSLAEFVHLNKFYLAHEFTEYYGQSPINYLIDRRIECAKELLESTDHKMSDIAQASGFSSQSYFTQSFKKRCGVSPAEYRKRNQKQ